MTPDRLTEITNALDGITPRCVSRSDAEALLGVARELLGEVRRLSANDTGPIAATLTTDMQATLMRDAAAEVRCLGITDTWAGTETTRVLFGLMFSRYALQKANEGHANRLADMGRRCAEADQALIDAGDERRELVALCLALHDEAESYASEPYWDDDDMPTGWRKTIEALRGDE